MFLGEYTHSLDAKGRIAVPAKFRGELGDTVIVSRYFDGCLAIYSKAGWDKEMEALNALNRNKKEVRQLIDYRTSKATECSFDVQGRINIPSVLMKAAKLEKECVFTGAIDVIKLWSKEGWDAYNENLTEDNITEIAENL